MTAVDAVLAKRRKAYHDGVADAALAAEDAAEARRAEMEAAMEAERKRREKLSRRRENLSSERQDSMIVAEAACREMVTAMHKVRSCGGELAAVYVALGEHCPPGLAGESAMRSLGDKLSAGLRSDFPQ